MDKAQKELIKTYYRKRDIAAKQQDGYDFKFYEISEYAIDNKIMTPEYVINNFTISSVLTRKPNLAKYFSNYSLSPNALDIILKDEPKLIIYFENQLKKLDKNHIYSIIAHAPELLNHPFFSKHKDYLPWNYIGILLSRNPEYINMYEHRLDEISDEYVAMIIRFRKSLFPYFKDRIPKLDNDATMSLLFNYPEMIDQYNWNLTNIDNYDKRRFIGMHPELEKYFKN
jgi:hypothetical protein